MEKKPQLKVVIVGGSIAGLTLAHCLERYGIDYVVLERRDSIAPQVGASVSLMPNGARILDQLGMFDTIFKGIEPCVFMQTWTAEGKLLSETDAPILTGKRLGYTITFLERERLLQILYAHLPEKSKVLTGKYVKFIEQRSTEAVVHCEDGSIYPGDVIAGADGIHSVIRAEMRRHIAKEGTVGDLEALKRDESALSAEYSCLFGVSKPIPGLEIGHTHRSSGKGASTLLFGGPGGKIYWFLFTQNEERTFGPDIPRYTKSDETNHVAKYMYHHVSGNIVFSEVWKNRIVANFVPIEEMENEHWIWNRIACLGDSVHKMTPNLGQGANCAIESAADLANSLAKLMNNKKGKPSCGDITNALSLYHDRRHKRANMIVKAANKFTRVEALATTGDWFASMFIIPRLGDILADRGAKVQIGATKLDCLPMPKRALEGTMPWSVNAGIGKEENRKRRAQLALPLLLLSIAFFWISRANSAQQMVDIDEGIRSGILFFDGLKVPLVTRYFGWPAIDRFIAKAVGIMILLDGSSGANLKMVSVIVGMLPMMVIWTIESFRRGNALSIANIFPTLFLFMTQIFGSGVTAPIYYFFHYVQLPQENFAALDNRMTNMAFIKVFVPALLMVVIGPAFAIYHATEIEVAEWIYGLSCYLSPIYLTLFLRISKYLVKDTTRQDRLYKPTADLPYMRIIYGLSITICASFHIYTHLTSTSSFFTSLREELLLTTRLTKNYPQNLTDVWNANQIVSHGAAAIWILLHFADLKFAGRLRRGWFFISAILLTTNVFAGMNASLLIMWTWREEIMARKLEMEA